MHVLDGIDDGKVERIAFEPLTVTTMLYKGKKNM